MHNHLTKNTLLMSAAICCLCLLSNASFCFDVFIYAGNKNKPNFEEFGAKRSIILYEQYFYKNNNNNLNKIESAQLDKVIHRIKESNADYVHIDIETWLGKGQQINETYIERYVELVNFLKAKFPEKKFGYYDVVPAWAHWDILQKPLWEMTWSAENLRRQKIADAVDTIHPCLYTYHDNYEDWEKWASLILKQAKINAKGKPVIPFLWPRFHQSAIRKSDATQYLPPDFWKKQLAFVAKQTDGVVIWSDGEYDAWNESSAWWTLSKNFMSTINSTKP